jgi:hypothetical protein
MEHNMKIAAKLSQLLTVLAYAQKEGDVTDVETAMLAVKSYASELQAGGITIDLATLNGLHKIGVAHAA